MCHTVAVLSFDPTRRSGPEAGAENQIISKVRRHDNIACCALDVVRAYLGEIEKTTYFPRT
jgi:hypothetical protein